MALNTLLNEQFQKYNIALLQEPPLSKNSLIKIPHPLHALAAPTNPRTAIIFNPSLDIWAIPHLSDRDCQVAIWYLNKRPTILVSAYWEINSPNIPEKLSQAIKYAKRGKYDLLLAIDSNAHHHLWGSPDINTRGLKFEEFISSHNLTLLNDSQAPTFEKGLHKTHIDLTLTSPRLVKLVQTWEVLPDDLLSDHKCLLTKILAKGTKTVPQTVPNYTKVNWQGFHNDLVNETEELMTLEMNSSADLDQITSTLTGIIQSALMANAPKLKIPLTHKKPIWWTEEVLEARRALRTAHHKWLKHQSPLLHASYIELRSNYQKVLRAAKRTSWKEFTTNCTTLPQTSKLARAILTQKSPPIGLTQNPQGVLAKSGKESLQNLLSTHFPGSTPPHPNQRYDKPTPPKPNDWITPEMVQSTINSFQSDKAAGPDNLKVRALKHFPQQIYTLLAKIYNKSLDFEFMPTVWRESRAIFIPKAGKSDMQDPKSYRPICLSNFLFKTFEKLMLLKLGRDNIYPNKLSHHQHGFKTNRSTYTALSTFVNEIELAKEQRKHTVAVFLDIQGAFDNMDPKGAIDVLESWGAPKSITGVLRHYYSNRLITVNHPHYKLQVQPRKGSGQGNVLSPMLWNCTINEIGTMLSNENIKGQLFADDIAILASHENLNVASAILQRALNHIRSWALKYDLKVNTTKSQYVIFSTKCPANLRLALRWGNQMLQRTPNIKYLGLNFTERLDWQHHLNIVTSKAKQNMRNLVNSLGKTWGPTPTLTRWLYTAIIRPQISYAAHIWASTLKVHKLDQISRHIQRWALKQIGVFREKTPTAGLEIIAAIPPLHLYLQEISIKTIARMKYTNVYFQKARTGHLSKWQGIINHFIPEVNLPNDRCPKVIAPIWQNTITPPDPDGSDPQSTYIFTDGSGNNNLFGSGFLIQTGKLKARGIVNNGPMYTVFLSEVRAIYLAVDKFLNNPPPQVHSVHIFSDSTSAIQAIKHPTSNSKLIQLTWQSLSALDARYKWSLTWVRGHAGNKGNEEADTLAKAGTRWGVMGPPPFIPIPFNYIKKAIKNFTLQQWNNYWVNRPDCRQTKLWFPKPELKKSQQILTKNRLEVGLLIRWLTGHCYLARHQSLIYPEINPTCNLCQQGEETPWHLLTECPHPLVQNKLPPDHWEVDPLLNLINKIKFLEVPDYADINY
jgi:ribonuclease HI